MREKQRSGWKASQDAWLKLKPAARESRKSATPAEQKLWQALRSFRAEGFPFRRQHAIGSYIVDFYCPRARLVVEVDGPIHNAQEAEDAARTEFLQTNRLRVLRFKNHEVLQALDWVLTAIRASLDGSPSP